MWWLGEGLGGLLTGTANPVTGAPGAALLYAVIAVLAWPPRTDGPATDRVPADSTPADSSIAGASPVGTCAARLTWAVLWAGSTALVLLTPAASGGMLTSAALAVLFAVIAGGIFVPATTRPVLILAAVAALGIWAFGEGLGAMFSGSGTDPNTGPLLVLLAAAYWPLHRADQRRVKPRADGLGRPLRAASGPMIRSRSGSVAAMTANDRTSPPVPLR